MIRWLCLIGFGRRLDRWLDHLGSGCLMGLWVRVARFAPDGSNLSLVRFYHSIMMVWLIQVNHLGIVEQWG